MNNYIENLFKDHSKTIVGRLCKNIELIEKRTDLTETQKLGLIKDFNKELIYQEFRNLQSQIKSFFQGREFGEFKIYDPKSSTKEV